MDIKETTCPLCGNKQEIDADEMVIFKKAYCGLCGTEYSVNIFDNILWDEESENNDNWKRR